MGGMCGFVKSQNQRLLPRNPVSGKAPGSGQLRGTCDAVDSPVTSSPTQQVGLGGPHSGQTRGESELRFLRNVIVSLGVCLKGTVTVVNKATKQNRWHKKTSFRVPVDSVYFTMEGTGTLNLRTEHDPCHCCLAVPLASPSLAWAWAWAWGSTCLPHPCWRPGTCPVATFLGL